MRSVHEILRLRLRMTVGPVREILRLRLRMTMGTATLPACHPEPRAKDLVLEGSKMGAVREILRLRLRMTVGPVREVLRLRLRMTIGGGAHGRQRTPAAKLPGFSCSGN